MKNLLIILFFTALSIASFGQDKIAGIWKAENDNTLVKIEKTNGVYIGKIISSDNREVKPGTQIIKDVKLNKNKWVGQIYAPKRNEWYDIELSPVENKLEIVIVVGFFSKTIEWTKYKAPIVND